MRIKCKCGAIPCWWYAPAGEWNIRSRALCADCVSRAGDDTPGFPDDPPTDWDGNIIPAIFREWPKEMDEQWASYSDGTPGYWLWIDPFDKKGRVLPNCEYCYIGYHKRKWQWLKKKCLTES